jgi:hypothetical protein
LKIEQEDSLEKNTVSLTKSSDFKPKTHGTIIFWSLIASFTRFIPLPLVDDLLESGLEKMMFKQIAEAHSITLSDSDLDILSYDTTDFSGLKVALRSSARLVGRFFLKTLLVFELKDAADTFSAVYHLGYLLDYTSHTGKFEQCSTSQLRVAIDRVCQNAGTSPVNRVFIGIMKESLSMLGAVKDFIIKSVFDKGEGGQTPENIAKEAPPEAEELVVKLEKGLNLMPPKYFEVLLKNLDAEIQKTANTHH